MRTHCPGPRVEDSESRILGSAIWIEFHKMHIYANVRFSIYTYKQYYVNSWYETSICTHIQRERVTEGDAIRSHGNAHSARHVRPMCTCIAAISIIPLVSASLAPNIHAIANAGIIKTRLPKRPAMSFNNFDLPFSLSKNVNGQFVASHSRGPLAHLGEPMT